MRNLLMVCCLLLIASACRPKDRYVATDEMRNDIPDSVIAFDSMVDITLDIHLAEAWTNESKTDSLSKDERLKQYYGQIFGLHQVSSERYKRSYQYYVAHPILMQDIYTRVTEKLTILESEQSRIKKPTQ